MHGIVEELRKEVENLKKLLFNVVKVGTIVSVNEKEATARVEFKDRDGKVSAEIPFSFMHTLGDKTYSIPKVGQQVWCIFPPNIEDYGLIVGSNYNEKDRPPASDKNLFVHEFEDGTKIVYDKKNHKLTITVNGSIEITAITTHNGNVTINGNLFVNGNITASGEIADLNGSKGSLSVLRETYNTHTHNGGPPPDQTL